MHHFIGDGELVIKNVQMANRRMDVYGFDRVSPSEMDAIEILGQPQQILAHGTGTGHFSANRHIPVIGRRRHVAKQQMFSTNGDLSVRVPGGDRELGRCLADPLHNKVTAHAHIFTVNRAARFAQDIQSFVIKELNPDLFQNAHGTIVDRVNALRG